MKVQLHSIVTTTRTFYHPDHIRLTSRHVQVSKQHGYFIRDEYVISGNLLTKLSCMSLTAFFRHSDPYSGLDKPEIFP